MDLPTGIGQLIELPRVMDPRGKLSFIEGMKHVPFEIKRVFYLYDVPPGESRGVHAHRTLHQFLISVSGSFDVAMDDGKSTQVVHLARPSVGLHIPPMVWAQELNFSQGAVCLVLASDAYDESDYIRDRERFLAALAT